MNLSDYVTETEAAKLLGLQSGKGSVWRHLRKHAPHIEIINIFGKNAVKRDELVKWNEGGRQKVIDAFSKRSGNISRKTKMRAAMKMLQRRKAANELSEY